MAGNKLDIAVYTRLRFWVQFVLPSVYDDSLSYMELLTKVVAKLNELGEDYNQLVEIIEQTGYDYTQMEEDIAVLKTQMQNVIDGDYVDGWKDALFTMLDESIKELWSRAVQFVQFGITDDGYFFADIPDNWSMLHFETGYDESKPDEYLHLILNY